MTTLDREKLNDDEKTGPQCRINTHHRLGSSSNQSSNVLRSSDIRGVMALSCLGRLNVSKSTCSAGNATLTSLECCGGCRRDIIEESAISRTLLGSLPKGDRLGNESSRIYEGHDDEQKISKNTTTDRSLPIPQQL